MSKPGASAARRTLAEVAPGAAVRVARVDVAHAARLAFHGLFPGADVTIERDAPFGGPRIVRIGGARLALAQAVARTVDVEPIRDQRRAERSTRVTAR
jgi:Fe2+ transport system protein FeoA